MADSPPPQPRRGLGFLLPGLAGYDRANLPRDLLAGCVLAGLLVPQGLGYAGIALGDADAATIPIQRGLYAATLGLIVYALLGTNRQLAVSPTSSAAAMLAAAVAPLASGASSYFALGSGLAIATGVLLILGGVLRLGFASDFIAKPVLQGFTFGLALRIIVKQAPDFFGVKGAKGNVFAQAGHVLSSLGDAQGTTVLVGASALALMIVLPRITKAVPPSLAALVLGILAVRFLGLEDRGV